MRSLTNPIMAAFSTQEWASCNKIYYSPQKHNFCQINTVKISCWVISYQGRWLLVFGGYHHVDYLKKVGEWRWRQLISGEVGGGSHIFQEGWLVLISIPRPHCIPKHKDSPQASKSFPPHHLPPLFRTPILSAHLQKMRKGWKMVLRLSDN